MERIDTPSQVRISFEEWAETYKPIVNTISGSASFDDGDGGLMFETYGEEVKFVLFSMVHGPRNVWTYIDGDDGNTLIVEGYHLVNRIGHFITEVPAREGTHYEISITD